MKAENGAGNTGERKIQPPNFKTHRFTGIPYLPRDAIKIDAELSDWKDVPKLELDPVLKGRYEGDVQPAHQTAYVACASKGMSVAVDIIDTTCELENHNPISVFWLNDCLEIFFDTLNTKYSLRGEVHTQQFFAFPFGHENDQTAGGYEAVIEFKNGRQKWYSRAFSQQIMPRAGKKTEKGWTLEILIPKKLLRRGTFAPGESSTLTSRSIQEATSIITGLPRGECASVSIPIPGVTYSSSAQMPKLSCSIKIRKNSLGPYRDSPCGYE